MNVGFPDSLENECKELSDGIYNLDRYWGKKLIILLYFFIFCDIHCVLNSYIWKELVLFISSLYTLYKNQLEPVFSKCELSLKNIKQNKKIYCNNTIIVK